jgi:hypothetical protein
MFLPAEFFPVTNRAYYDWVDQECNGSLQALSRYVPPRFECYLHICHPVWKLPETVNEAEYKRLSETEQAELMVPIRWSEAVKNRINDFNGLTTWRELGNDVDYRNIKPGSTTEPLEGLPTVEQINAIETVANTAGNPDATCICAFWEGFGDSSDELGRFTSARTYKMAQQKHYLVQGPQNVLFNYWRTLLKSREYWAPVKAPQAVWPTDQKWFFAIPFHRHSAFFGGTKEMAESILKSDIEAYELPEGHIFKF